MLQVSAGPMEEKQERVFLHQARLPCVCGRIQCGQRGEQHRLLSPGGFLGTLCIYPSPQGRHKGGDMLYAGSLAGRFGQKCY